MDGMTLSPPGLDQATLARSAPRLNLGRAATPAQIDKSAQEFEGVFISQMLSHMWSSVEVDPVFGGGPAEETFRGLMIEEQGKAIAKAGGLGIADHVRRQLLLIQEMQLQESGQELPQ
ncbi:rod-binding protein [Rhodocista pekingensis]|uniref:Rod-binding protein n=1 Tax=Rhodocista pekingensis TaxID=201185 RepID=A0ABW2KQQ3_9PROT